MLWNKIKKLITKNGFDERLHSRINSMIEICFEYAGWNKEEVDSIYILCSYEVSYFFYFFYSINGNIVEKHLVNNYLRKKCNVSVEQQKAANLVGIEDLRKIVALFKEHGKDVPRTIKITYSPATEKMNTDFDYQNRVAGTNLLAEDLVEEWIESLKKNPA